MSIILNGFPDEEVASTLPNAFDNFIGGTPVTLADPEKFPSAAPECPICNESMSFIMQLYCPVNANNRVLYFFYCLQRDCQVSARICRVFRISTRVSESQKQVPSESSIMKMNFDWRFDEDDDKQSDDTWFNLSSVGNIANSNESITSHAITQLRSFFKCHYIQVYDEEVKVQQNEPQKACLQHWVLDYKAEEEFEEEDENDEKSSAFTSHFQLHLATRDPRYGLEPIRYAWTGHPIFTTAAPCDDWESHLKCPRCGGHRVFEVQLFSTLNNYLSKVEDSRPVINFDPDWPLSFSTVIVFSCQADCTPEEWVEEGVLVQKEHGESVFASDN